MMQSQMLRLLSRSMRVANLVRHPRYCSTKESNQAQPDSSDSLTVAETEDINEDPKLTAMNESVKKILMQFFDDEKNWGYKEVLSGREWNINEISLKSNTDLHKLWYVLVKERNMLKSMKREAESRIKSAEKDDIYEDALLVNPSRFVFPNPERLYRVEKSMMHIEKVVRIRNKAYLQLEEGHTGETPTRRVTSLLGFHYERDLKEHLECQNSEKQWKTAYDYYEQPELNNEQLMYQRVWKEKQWYKQRDKHDDQLRINKQLNLWYSN